MVSTLFSSVAAIVAAVLSMSVSVYCIDLFELYDLLICLKKEKKIQKTQNKYLHALNA